MSNPTLKTIKMVEKTIRNSEDSLVKVAEIKRKLPKKVNHAALIEILAYLEESRKIYVTVKGITWIENKSKKLAEAIRKGHVYPDDFAEK